MRKGGHETGERGLCHRLIPWTLMAAVAACPLNGAASLRQEDLDGLLHWAYSAAYGTGFYRIGEDKVFVAKVEAKIKLGWLQNQGVDTTLKLPVTFGLQNFDLGEVGDILDLVSSLKTVTFVPGLAFDLPIKGSWILKPYVHYGMGARLSGGERAQIHYFGINSWLELPSIGDFRLHLFNGLQWFGQNPNRGSSDGFARVVTGLEGNIRLGHLAISGRSLYFKPHIVHYWYFDSLGFSQIFDPPVEIRQEFEVALAVGIEERISLKLFSFDRLGIAYKGGGDIHGIRIYISSIFQ